MKKILMSVLLAILLVCGVVMPNITAKAAVGDEGQDGGYKYIELEDGTVEIARYNGSATELTIPSTLGGKTVTSIADNAFEECSNLTKITIPEGVTSIGSDAFAECSGLTSIDLPEGLTSIGDYAFHKCSSLANIDLPEGLTSIGAEVFFECSSLTNIDLPEGLTRIGVCTFNGCISLTNIDLPEGLTSIGYGAFGGCSSLVTAIIPRSVTSMGENVFDGCNSLVIHCYAGSEAETYAKANNHIYDNFSLCTAKLTTTSYICDGKKKEPTVTVKDGSKTLKKGTDYTVKYDKNIGVGKATVTITGAGKYTGTITKTFTITKAGYYNSTTNGGTWKNGTYTLGGVKMTNIFFSDGKYTYYLQADGTAMKNRLTYHPDGVHLIYFDDKGHELFDQFQYCKDVGYTCYFDTNGYLYKDVITFVDSKPYYLDGDGRMKQNEYFKFDNGVDLGYAQADGSLMNSGFGYDPFGQVVFYHWNGMIARGLITDGAWYYDMDLTDGHLVGKFAAN